MAAPEAPLISVEVWVSASPRHAQCLTVKVAEGCCAGDAVQASGVFESPAVSDMTSVMDGLKDGRWALAIWGRKVSWNHRLRPGDRLELLRALTVDPKEARRVRYRAQGEKLPKGFHRGKNTADPTRTS